MDCDFVSYRVFFSLESCQTCHKYVSISRRNNIWKEVSIATTTTRPADTRFWKGNSKVRQNVMTCIKSNLLSELKVFFLKPQKPDFWQDLIDDNVLFQFEKSIQSIFGHLGIVKSRVSIAIGNIVQNHCLFDVWLTDPFVKMWNENR